MLSEEPQQILISGKKRKKDVPGWSRQSTACEGCRKQKMRCLASAEGQPCQRCAAAGKRCVYVPASMRKSDRNETMKIKQLRELEQLSSTRSPATADCSSVSPGRLLAGTSHYPSPTLEPSPSNTGHADATHRNLPNPDFTPLGLLADASLRKVTTSNPSGTVRGAKRGLANEEYFQSQNHGPIKHRISNESASSLYLLTEGIITPKEAHDLFALYFAHCHLAVPLLDADNDTTANTAARSPFLFTCVCTVASRYYTTDNKQLYSQCLAVAERLLANLIIKGIKNIDIIVGLFLICQWNQPAERFSEERMFQFSGMAIRMGVELNLHCVAPPCTDTDPTARSVYECEVRYGERAWMYAFIIDRSISHQLGKPYAISREDEVISSYRSWYRSTGASGDTLLCYIVEMQKTISRAVEVLCPKNPDCFSPSRDYRTLTRTFLSQLEECRAFWLPMIENYNITCEFLYQYYRLFIVSFAIQHALGLPQLKVELPFYVALAAESASKAIRIVCDEMLPSGLLRHSIDCNFVFLTFSSCFLLKLMSPAFTGLVDAAAGLSLVGDAAKALETCAVDDTHTPTFYAYFLRRLMAHERVTINNVGAGYEIAQAVSTVGGVLDSAAGHQLSHSSDFDQYFVESESSFTNPNFWDNVLMPGYGFGNSLAGGNLLPTF